MFLLLALIGYLLMFFFPLAFFVSDLAAYKLYAYNLKNVVPDADSVFRFYIVWPVTALLGGCIFLTITSILQYKNRLYQLKLNKINMLMTIFIVGGIFFIYPAMIEKEISGGTSFEIGAYFPLASIILLILANRFITKDEKLIRSVDRIR